EHAISMMMALARHIPAANAAVHAGRWERSKFIGIEVSNKTLGVIGLGNIGRIVSERAIGLKMKVIGYDPILTGEAAARIGVEMVTLEQLYRRADFITVHAPLTHDTKSLVGAAAFAMMKPGVRIINCARGGIVEKPALAQAVATGEAQIQVAIDIAQQTAEFLINGVISHSVNMPALSPKELETLGPHLRLAERLGRLAAQLIAEPPAQITVGLGGDAAGLKAEPITAAALKGLLSGFLDQDFNYVSAPFIARERGIAVTESRSRETTDYINTLTLSVRTASGAHDVAGAVIGNRGLRLVRIDGYRVEAVPEGYFLMLHNRDVPGVVGAVGSMLGQAGVNIAGLELGRDRAGGMALSLVEVDGAVPAEVLERLKTIPAIVTAALLKL